MELLFQFIYHSFFSLKEEYIFTHFLQILHYCVTGFFYEIMNNHKTERITMSCNKILLPKSVSDSCYASLTQIYIDIFEVSTSSHLSLSTRNQRRITTGRNIHSPGRLNKKSFDVVRLDKYD